MKRTLIRSKVAPPDLPERLVRRERLIALLSGLIERYPVVWVRATAGAGKTTAVVEAARHLSRPLAWLTLDSTDAAPGRLLTYLEAALEQQLPAVAGVATRALSSGISHREAAGLLAEAAAGAPVVLVLDDLERIRQGEDALDVVGALARYSPETLRLVFVGRRALSLDLGHKAGFGHVAEVGERDLVFTRDEAREALRLAGKQEMDAEAAVEATGGWVTGVLFEAWRAADHVPGMGGEADPLYGYLSTQILDQLEPEEVRFLISTSLLETVTHERGEALGERHAGARLATLRGKYLPVTWSADGRSMRAHRRFREYLLELLSRRPEREVLWLRQRFGHVLAREGHHEEAAEEFLRAGAWWQAAKAAETSIGAVVERLDFDVAEYWLRELLPHGRSDSLTIAELMLAIGRERYWRAAQIGDELAAAGGARLLAKRSRQAASMLIWAYWHMGRVDDARALLGIARDGPELGIVRAMVALCESRPPPLLPEISEPYGGPLQGLLMRIHYTRGHFQKLLEAAPDSAWAKAMGAPVRIGALRATGRIEQALQLYRTTRAREPGSVWLHALVAVDLMLDLGRREEAWELLKRGRALIAATGSWPFDLLGRVLEAKLHLRLDRNAPAALDILGAIEERSGRYAFIRELVDTWGGFALLLESESQEARRRLGAAVESMVRADRMLELPVAAVYLAEAEWRCGDEEAADRAADLALDAAQRQGSKHLLMQALADFQSVASRRMDAEPGRDSAWHGLARDFVAHCTARAGAWGGGRVSLRDLGAATVVVDGLEARPLIRKSVELLAFLASRPRGEANRPELLDALFEGRADGSARSYLRQALYRLRGVLPAGTAPVTDGEFVRLSAPESVRSDAARLEALLDEAARLEGETRLETLLSAVQMAEAGPYLADVDSEWAEERRRLLAEHVAMARLDAATVAFQHGRYAEVEMLLESLLREDPHREQGWRLAMLLADALGKEDEVVATYMHCKEVLSELGVGPSEATVQLFDRLRRAPVGASGC